MKKAAWPRFWSATPSPTEVEAEILRAALTASSLPALLEACVHSLLEAAGGDRAGVWLQSCPERLPADQPAWDGVVSDGEVASTPQHWNRLEVASIYLQTILAGPSGTAPEIVGNGEASMIPALLGMRGVVWLPLRVRGQTIGLAMVASRESHWTIDSPMLQYLSGQIALAAAERWQAQRLEAKRNEAGESRGEFAAGRGEGGEAARLKAELRSVIEATDCGVLLLDDSGRIRFANPWLAQLLGLELHRLAEWTDFTALVLAVEERVRDPKAFGRFPAELCGGGQAAFRDELELISPARRILERVVRPVLDAAGARLGWLEIFRDITGQRLIQSKLLQTEKMAAIGQLVSGIAHELNNPLTGILGYAQLLLGRGLAPSPLADAQKICREAERARHIVQNLLQFAREHQLERTAVDLNEVVERTLALRSYELKVEDIVVELDLEPALPLTRADPIQLQQVVLNLLVNGEQSILHGKGRGRIRIRTRRLGGSRLSLEVSDDGPGVAPEIASRIFDPFFTTKPPGEGTGLGLSIAYGIVQQHGGEIYLDSQAGQGATFVVELPLVEVTHQQAARIEAQPTPVATGGRRILVVEDEPTVGQLIADVLGEERHEVEVVLDSQEGLSRLSRQEYDLVICDLRMPRLDGQQFHRALVAAGSPLQRRLLFITGDTLSPRTQAFLDSTGLSYLAKPFLVEELKLAVNRLLGPQGSEVRAAPAYAVVGGQRYPGSGHDKREKQ